MEYAEIDDDLGAGSEYGVGNTLGAAEQLIFALVGGASGAAGVDEQGAGHRGERHPDRANYALLRPAF